MRECNLSQTIDATKVCMLTIGRNIKALRKENNLSQFDLACLMDCDKCLISELERGIYNNITVKTLLKFCYIFEVELIEIIS